MTRAVLLAGGWAHPPTDAIAATRELVVDRGFELHVVTEPGATADALDNGCDLLVVAACWFSMTDDRYTREQRAEYAVGRDRRREAALDSLRQGGCPLLALHTAVICFDGWDVWRSWLGGAWNWSTSWHPEPSDLVVEPERAGALLASAFSVVDEEYQGLDLAETAEVVARSAGGHPLVWLHDAGPGRCAVNVLGHHRRSLAAPAHRRLNGRLLDWLLA